MKSSRLPDDCPYKHRFWAPEIHGIGGRLFLIFTGHNWIRDEFNKGGKTGAYVAFVGVADQATGAYENITWLEGGGCEPIPFNKDGTVKPFRPSAGGSLIEASPARR